MTKLPKIYHKEINNNIANNKQYAYASKNEIHTIKNDKSVEEMINSLFKENGFIFNKPVIIRTKNKNYDTAIIKKEQSKIYTLTEEVIDINDILSIERKKI